MNNSFALRSGSCLLIALIAGCNLLDTTSKEQTLGRGAQAFDPYTGNSGALRLSLQWLQGCSMLANGTPVGRGTAAIPDPGLCPDLNNLPDPSAAPIPPTGKMELVRNQPYFLNELTFMDEAVNLHNDPTDMEAVINWFSTQSKLKALNWSGIGVLKEDWLHVDLGAGPGTWARQVTFANAQWMNSTEDTFKVEVLDTAGTPRATVNYTRKSFLGESSTAGHSRIAWRVEGVAPPEFPGDVAIHPSPLLPDPPTTRTILRVDMVGSTDPFTTFTPTELGDGAIRVTWSAMPDDPFYFPVTVVERATLPSTCFPADGGSTQVACGFGLDPQIQLTRPANGRYFEPGEPFDLLLRIKDSNGNLLHDPQFLPSGADFFAGTGNGLMYSTAWLNYTFERDNSSAFMVAGPIDRFASADPSQPKPWFQIREHAELLDGSFATEHTVPGVFNSPWPTRRPIAIPADAAPGTYMAMLKVHRQFAGERTSKLNVAMFQIGQDQATTYPGRVGNCQICHRGVLSLDNLRHGLSVDHIESCKACHDRTYDDYEGQITTEVHQIHFRSLKFPLAKNDCTVCHLSRASATRPSINACSSCHPSVHGGEYFQLQFAVNGAPNRFGNCAETCHAKTPPSNHILPAN